MEEFFNLQNDISEMQEITVNLQRIGGSIHLTLLHGRKEDFHLMCNHVLSRKESFEFPPTEIPSKDSICKIYQKHQHEKQDTPRLTGPRIQNLCQITTHYRARLVSNCSFRISSIKYSSTKVCFSIHFYF